MHVLMVRSGALGAGGISRVIESWSRVLCGAGHRVTVISAGTGRHRSLPSIGGLSTVLYPEPSTSFRLTRFYRRMRNACRTAARIHSEDPASLLVSHNSQISVFLRRTIPGVPLLQTFHSPQVDENRLMNWKYTRHPVRKATYPLSWAGSWASDRLALGSIDCAHTLSRYTWTRLNTMYPGSCSRIPWEMIPGSYDSGLFRPAPDRAAVRRRLGLEETQTILFTLRRLVPRNGVDRILDCAGRLRGKYPGLKFLIGGTGELKDSLQRRVEREDLAGLVSMLGLVPDDDLAAYYQAADAFLLPTRDLECFGLPVIEAMGCALTPLILPDGGPPEICASHPQCIARSATDEGFFDIVQDFLEGRIPRPVDDLARFALENYSETALAPSILRTVERLAGSGCAR